LAGSPNKEPKPGTISWRCIGFTWKTMSRRDTGRSSMDPRKNKLYALLTAIQSGKKIIFSKSGAGKKVILKNKLITCSPSSLLKAWVIYKIRHDVEIGYSNYKSGFSEAKLKEIELSKQIWDLSEKDRETEILNVSRNVEINKWVMLGRNPCYIVGYEWIDPKKQTKLRRDFLVGAEYCYG
jgi:hypothetical protein